MRKKEIEKLREASGELVSSLEQLEQQMELLNDDANADSELWHVARLLYKKTACIKTFWREKFMRQSSFESIQKKLDKKSAELVEVRALRKKLADREKNICAEIENLQNQKVEAIFLQVKREIRNEKLEVSSGSILPLLEALRGSQQTSNGTDKEVGLQADASISAVQVIAENGRKVNEDR